MDTMEITLASTASLVTRGIVALAFGVMVLVWPSVTLHVILILFALYALLGGAAAAVTAVVERHNENNWVLGLIFGTISALIGVYLLANPHVTALVLIFMIGLYAVVAGIIDLIVGISMRKVIKGEWILIIVGILSIGVGLYFFANPGAGAVALLWLIAIYALVSGVLLLAAAASHNAVARRKA